MARAAAFAAMILGTALNAQEPETHRAFHDTFDGSFPQGWHVADYVFSHPHFATDWRRANARQQSGGRGIVLALQPGERGSGRFTGGSIRREERSGHGRYEAVLQPARGSGLVTGFFVYTGAYYGTRHDEIDMEFLGRDTRAVLLSWFTGGKRRSRLVQLGFDAADAPRRYAFEWETDRIRWFARGQLLHEEFRSTQHPLPEVPGFAFVNLWAAAPALENWAGRTSPGTRAQALLLEVSYRAAGTLEIAGIPAR